MPFRVILYFLRLSKSFRGPYINSFLNKVVLRIDVDVEEFRRLWDRIKPIPRNTTDKCSKHNPKIGQLTLCGLDYGIVQLKV